MLDSCCDVRLGGLLRQTLCEHVLRLKSIVNVAA